MLETSLDLLYIVLALCALWLTIFTCWWLFYVIMIIRRVYQITKTIKEKLKLIDELTETAKNKLEHASLYVNLAAEGIGKIANYFYKHKKSAPWQEEMKEEETPKKTTKKKATQKKK